MLTNDKIMFAIYDSYRRLAPASMAEDRSPAEIDVLRRALQGALRSNFRSLGREVSEEEASRWHAERLSLTKPIVLFDARPPLKHWGDDGSKWASVLIETTPLHQELLRELVDLLTGIGFQHPVEVPVDGHSGPRYVLFAPRCKSKKARHELVMATVAALVEKGYPTNGMEDWREK